MFIRKGPSTREGPPLDGGRYALPAPAFNRQLRAGVPDQILQVLVLLRIDVLRIAQFLLGALEGGLDRVLVDFLLRDGVLREHVNAIAFDCRESSTNGEPEGLAVLGHAQFAMLDLGQQRNVTIVSV